MKLILNKSSAELRHERFSKRSRKARSKGNRGIKGIADMFSDWYGVHESFFKTGSSGIGTRVGQAGDLAAPPGFMFVVESKNDERWSFFQLLQLSSEVQKKTSKKPAKKSAPLRELGHNIFWDFWAQVEKSCADHNNHPRCPYKKYPMVIFTKNNEHYFCIIHPENTDREKYHLPESLIILQHPDMGEFNIFLLEHFLAANPRPNLLYNV